MKGRHQEGDVVQEDLGNDPFLDTLFAEAALFVKKANEAGPENADPSYAARLFHRLVEAVYRRFHPDEQPDFDVGAVAQTAETYFARMHQQWFIAQTAQLMMNCLQRATNEEGRKIEFPVFDYDAMSEPAEEKLESYGSGNDPHALHKFAQRIVTRGVLRVRGDQDEIYRAILELNEAQFPKPSTREEFAENLPDDIRDRHLAEFDAALNAQPDRTPETVAKLLRDERAEMIRDYSLATYRAFMDFGDYAIRCGISATLFLAAQYANVYHAAAAGQPDDVVDSLRPGLTDLKKNVAAFFADWLTQPLATRPRTGKKPKADLSRLSDHYNAIIDDWTDAFALCRSMMGLRSDKLRARWRSGLKKQYPMFPEDLIERLQPMAEWPERISDVCVEQGGEDKPQDIALEHAARLCGAGEYAFKLTYLEKVFRKQKAADF
jgi:hypothetical protein